MLSLVHSEIWSNSLPSQPFRNALTVQPVADPEFPGRGTTIEVTVHPPTIGSNFCWNSWNLRNWTEVDITSTRWIPHYKLNSPSHLKDFITPRGCIPACNGRGWCVSQHAMGGGGVYPSMQWAGGCGGGVSQHAMGGRGRGGVYPSMQWVAGDCVYPSMQWVGGGGVGVYPSMQWAGVVCIPACNGREGRGGVYSGMQWVGGGGVYPSVQWAGVVCIPACNGRGSPWQVPPPLPTRRPLKRAVRTLLKCILV